jgi:hypothetical protein
MTATSSVHAEPSLSARLAAALDWVHARPSTDATDWELVCLPCGARLLHLDGYGLEPEGTSIAQQARTALNHARVCLRRHSHAATSPAGGVCDESASPEETTDGG